MSDAIENLNPYGIDWSNVDLASPCDRDLNIIDPLTFAGLLLEINCNLPDITPETVIAQFEMDLQSRVREAREIMRDNLIKPYWDARSRKGGAL